MTDTQIIVGSKHVVGGNRIFNSENITDSFDVHNSQNVKDSNLIYDSKVVVGSAMVSGSATISKSTNIVDSTSITKCENIYMCERLVDCDYCEEIHDSRDTHFSAESKILDHCLFCYNLEDMEYMIFNKKVDKETFDIIYEQYQMMIANENNLFLVPDWHENYIISTRLDVRRNWSRHYSQLTDGFKNWVKTLSGYDSTIMVSITNDKFFIS